MSTSATFPASPARSWPAVSSTPIATASLSGALLFGAVGTVVASFALALVMASTVAPAEIASHPVARELLSSLALVLAFALAHFAVAVGLLGGARLARLGGAVVALVGLAMTIVELAAIVTGRDPIAAEAADPARAAQGGFGMMLLVGAAYVAMLAASAWPRRA